MAKSDLHLVSGDYAPVAARITLFYERFVEGRIVTELVSRSDREVTFRALVYRSAADREPAATGWASEIEGDGDINTVACLENTETSAIGRALANLGFTASSRRPSAEEMLKASRARTSRERVLGASPHPRPPIHVVGAVDGVTTALRDVADLLDTAERLGLRAARVYALRARLAGDAVTLDELYRIERSLRSWLARRPGP
jgi:hypothetical protein